jgi:molecular chaperone DnaK (HSP70)
MKFPITRESLQAFDYAKEQEELRQEELQERVTQIIEKLCNEFKMNIRSNSQQKKFVWQLNSSNIHFNIRNHNSKFNYTLDEYLPRIIDKVKEIFIGCDIIIDPLKTYLIIDWS